MKLDLRKCLLASTLALPISGLAAAGETPRDDPQRLVLDAPIATWDEAIPLGNGLTGGLLWGTGNVINLSLDRGDLWDERLPELYRQPDWNWNTIRRLKAEGNQTEISRLFDAPYNMAYPTKLPGGRLVMHLEESLGAKTFELDMQQAVGRVVLTRGELECFFSATQPVAMIRVPDETLTYEFIRPEGLNALGYKPAQFGQDAGMNWMVQEAAEGLTYAVVVASKCIGNQTQLAVAITSNRDCADPLAVGKQRVSEALEAGYDAMLGPHRKWWGDFWATSSVAVPNPRIQRHYNLVKYFYGAASRGDAPPMPLQAVWTRDDGGLPPWKGDFHHDLNTQMTYLAYHTAGLVDSGLSFINYNWDLLSTYREFARAFYGVEGAAMPGVATLAGRPTGGWSQYALSPTNALWVGQTFYLHWRYTMDRDFLATRAYPWLSEMATGVVHLLEERDGKLYLPLSSSPEIHDNSFRAWLEPNSNHDLSLLQWTFEALAEMADVLGESDDVAKWRALRQRLDDLHIDEQNVLVFAKGEPFAQSHRHHSQTMAIHPLGTLHVEGSDRDRAVIGATLDRMHALGTQAWTGYSFSWFSCLAARAGRAEQALQYLEDYQRAFILRNGFHVNGDQIGAGLSGFRYRPFTLEGNFLAMEAVHEMLLQSWGGRVRVFPAVSKKWADVSFCDLRAQGGFKVSAQRQGGRTVRVSVTATVDQSLCLVDPFGGRPLQSNIEVERVDDELRCQLKKGQVLELTASPELEIGPSMGGNGGVYLLAEPGELVVELQKRDRNRRGRRTDLRAILVGPDRQVLQEATIPDDGKARGSGFGPAQGVRLSTSVPRKGVYALNVTTSQDRYGEEIVWGFQTNCPRYLIETSRGHKDERHQEPIVLAGSDRPADVCFLPRGGPLAMEITNLPENVEPLTVFDGGGNLLATLPVDDGKASHTFEADVPRDAVPWRLHLPVGQATVQIDGVTRWDRGDRYANLSLWTPQPTSHFPLAAYRWLLTPYSRRVHGRPGAQSETVFVVHNNSGVEKTIGLELEFPGSPWPVELSQERVVLGPKETCEVTLRYTIPAEGVAQVCHLRATPMEDPEFSTYATLTVEADAAPGTKAIDMPLVLKPYRHENEQFGYLPDYPVESQVYFSPKNQPFVRTGAGIATRDEDRWAAIDFRNTVTSADGSLEGQSFGVRSSKIAFDRQGNVYVLARAGRRDALLHSADGGRTFAAYPLPGRENLPCALDVEQFSGHNVPDGPPPIVRFTRTASDPKRIWRKIHDLELLLPEKTDAGLSLGEPILVSRQCIGLAAHSGIPSSVVSRGGKVHVVWAEATDPEVDVPGVPTYVATYDRETRVLGKPALVGYGPPRNDIHNSPSITMDSRGYLHVLVGTHGQPFPYARSVAPNDAQAGWTEPMPVGEGLRQTYIGLVCGPDDTLHAAFRLWRSGAEPFPASHHGTLAYQQKRPGQPWESPRVLIEPPFSEYSVYYHRLTIDHRGRLFLSYDYWSTYWFYRNDHRGSRRAVLMSDDGGETWKLAENRDFQYCNAMFQRLLKACCFHLGRYVQGAMGGLSALAGGKASHDPPTESPRARADKPPMAPDLSSSSLRT